MTRLLARNAFFRRWLLERASAAVRAPAPGVMTTPFWARYVSFWIFGYWPLVGPLAASIRLYRLLGRMESASDSGELERSISKADEEDVVVQLVAEENGFPRFLAGVSRLEARALRWSLTLEATDASHRRSSTAAGVFAHPAPASR